jgi:hypothetical protein
VGGLGACAHASWLAVPAFLLSVSTPLACSLCIEAAFVSLLIFAYLLLDPP